MRSFRRTICLFFVCIDCGLAWANPDLTDVTNQVMCVLSSGGSGFTTFESGLVHLCKQTFPERKCSCRPGDLVHLRLYRARSSHGYMQTYTTLVEVLGRAPWPPLTDASASQILNGQADGKLVRLKGVVMQVTQDDLDEPWNWIFLRMKDGDICLCTTESQFSRKLLESYIDAEVEVKGRCSHFEGWRKHLGYMVGLFGGDGIVLKTPAPADSFANNYRREDTPVHRTTACGRVLAKDARRLFLRTHDDELLVVSPVAGTKEAHVGDLVGASGFTGDDLFNTTLDEALIRNVSLGTNQPHLDEPAERISVHQLFKDPKGKQRIDMRRNGEIIRLAGNLNRSVIDQDRRTLKLDCENHEINVDISGLDEIPAIPENGSLLEIAGLCLAEFENNHSSALFPRFRNFTLIPRHPDDIRILRSAPWWTPMRLKALILGLLVVLGAILIWTRSVHVLSERRGRALAQAKVARVRAESKTEERTRLAVELHDALSQSLTGVALQIDAAVSSCQKTPTRTETFLHAAKTLLSSSRKELQACIWDLRNRTFEEKDLTEAIIKVLLPYSQQTKITVRFNVPREHISETTAHTIFSIVRELTANALRHGLASHVRIAGERDGENIRFSVTDDGTGFDVDSSLGPRDGHFGLLGIRERISGFGGSFQVYSVIGRGTRAVVTLKDPYLTEKQ